MLEGFSRGGLFAFNWAAAHPTVACIYADAPVCDFKSWPGGKGKGSGSPGDWQNVLKLYGLTEAEAMAYKLNPVDNLAPLAKAGVPLLHVVGDADDAVPLAENTAVVERRYKQLGGQITVIVKKGVGHHPHSLKDPTPIVDFILKQRRNSSGRKRKRLFSGLARRVLTVNKLMSFSGRRQAGQNGRVRGSRRRSSGG